MLTSAMLKLPLKLASPGYALEAQRVLATTAGASEVVVDSENGTASFSFEFPGNIDGVVRRLHGAGIDVGPMVDVRIPVKDLKGKTVDPAALLAALKASPAVAAAAYDGTAVTVTIASATNAFRYVFEEITLNGLTPHHEWTVARA